MPDTPPELNPFAGLSPHDWPRLADAAVAILRRSDTWDAFVAGSVAAAARSRGSLGGLESLASDPASRAHDQLVREAMALAGLPTGRLFMDGVARRLWETALNAGPRTAVTPARNPFPVRFDAALLAGGEGTRIGGGKAFVPLGGRPLAAWAAAAAGAYADRLLVVARTSADAERVAEAVAPFVAAPVVPVADRPGIDGPVAGLLGAADAADRYVLTVPVDVPFLPDWTAFALRPCAMAATDRPHPTVLFADAARLRRLLPAGSLLATLAPLAPAEVAFPEVALFNVNTPTELADAERRLGRR